MKLQLICKARIKRYRIAICDAKFAVCDVTLIFCRKFCDATFACGCVSESAIVQVGVTLIQHYPGGLPAGYPCMRTTSR